MSLLQSEDPSLLSSGVVSVLYLMQRCALFFANSASQLLAILHWRNDLHTVALLIYLQCTTLLALFLPLPLLLLFLLLSIAMRHTRVARALFLFPAAVLLQRHHAACAQLHFPHSTIALQNAIKQVKK